MSDRYAPRHLVPSWAIIEDMEAQARIDEQITRPGLRLEEEITDHADLLAWCKDNRKDQDDE